MKLEPKYHTGPEQQALLASAKLAINISAGDGLTVLANYNRVIAGSQPLKG